MSSSRLDIRMVERGLAPTRTKAQQLIEAGEVAVNGRIVHKASFPVTDADVVSLPGGGLRYVSRGGLKLEKAIREFGLSFNGCSVLDIGASTGGFTDCAFQHGAALVAAVDTGQGQLHESLRGKKELFSLEKTDFRTLKPEDLPVPFFDAIVTDVSFISLGHIFPNAAKMLRPGGFMLALIKPQFELEERIKLKNGIVQDEKLQRKAVAAVAQKASESGLFLHAITRTDADGKTKNIEFPALFRKAPSDYKKIAAAFFATAG